MSAAASTTGRNMRVTHNANETIALERLVAATDLIQQQERDIADLRLTIESLRAEIRALGGSR